MILALVVLCIAWYVIGFLSTFFVIYYEFGEFNTYDMVVSIIASVCGLYTFVACLFILAGIFIDKNLKIHDFYEISIISPYFSLFFP